MSGTTIRDGAVAGHAVTGPDAGGAGRGWRPRPGFGGIALFTLLAHLAVFGGYVALAQLFGGFSHAVCQWDCNWYGSIIERGYSRHVDAQGYANWAFFPLVPLLGGAVSRMFGLLFVPSLELVNLVAFLALVMSGVGYARRQFAMEDGFFVAALLISFPFGLYFRVPYSEAVYGLLILLTLWNHAAGRVLLAGVFAALLCATRPTGILLVAAIGLCFLGRTATLLVPDRRAAAVTLLRGTLFVAMGCCGLLFYMLYLFLHVGDPLAFSHVEHAWNRDFGNPVLRLWHGLGTPDMLMPNFLSRSSNSGRYLALAGVAGLVLVGVAAARRLAAEAIFLFLTLFAAASTSLEALPRIALCNPVSILLVGSLFAGASVPVRWGVLSLFLMVQTVLVLAWFNGWAFLT